MCVCVRALVYVCGCKCVWAAHTFSNLVCVLMLAVSRHEEGTHLWCVRKRVCACVCVCVFVVCARESVSRCVCGQTVHT